MLGSDSNLITKGRQMTHQHKKQRSTHVALQSALKVMDFAEGLPTGKFCTQAMLKAVPKICAFCVGIAYFILIMYTM